MSIYCPSCGRAIPDDSKICAYCGKSIPSHMVQAVPVEEKKKDKKIIVLAVVLVLIIPASIAIAATMYYYTTTMIPSPNYQHPPSIIFAAEYTNNKLTVTSVSPDDVYWVDIQIDGDYNTKPSHSFVTAGDEITGCYGVIRIIYIPNNMLIATFTFSE
ncbi:MAG: zinc ribbon domain-containing protein [Methanobacteriota archaeon]